MLGLMAQHQCLRNLLHEARIPAAGNLAGTNACYYVNGSASGLSGHAAKRALGYGTSKGNDVVGSKLYELSNHLGNVLEVITDRKWGFDDGVYNTTTGAKTSSTADKNTDYYLPTIMAYNDYDPYGMLLDGRKGTASGGEYRYGFQGQEKDDDLKGEGNSLNYEYRMHDPRIGRFFAIDPLAPEYPHNSPYAFSENRVVDSGELEGLESVPIELMNQTIRKGESMQQTGTASTVQEVALWMLKFVNGVSKTTTPQGALNSLSETVQQAYIDGKALGERRLSPQEWYARYGGLPDVRGGEGMLVLGKNALTGDADALGQIAGMFVMRRITYLPKYTQYANRLTGMQKFKKIIFDKSYRQRTQQISNAYKHKGSRVFTETAQEGDLKFYSTEVGENIIEFGGDFSEKNGILTIKNFDIDGAMTNKLGIKGIKNIVSDFAKQKGYKKVIIEGAPRTTGAKPGKKTNLTFDID